MALNTETFLNLKSAFSKSMHDFLEFDTTTNIAANKSIISTTLNNYDDVETGHFDNWWVEITEGANVGVERKTGSTAYSTGTGNLYVYGANLAAESAAVTCRLHRNDPARKTEALLDALKEIYPEAFVALDDRTLITGNILYDGHLEVWTSSTALTYWSPTNVTQAQASAAGSTFGGTYAAKISATAANGYISFKSDNYPKLLQLQDLTVNAYVKALPEVDDDATIVLYTKNAAGSTQTLTSTTACPAGEFSTLKLENQKLNPDIVEMEMRLKVTTNAKYVIFDDAYLNGMRMSEYLLPASFVGGNVSSVRIQNNGTSLEPVFFDINPFIGSYIGDEVNFKITNDGTYEWLKLLDDVSSERRMRLIGDKPLEQPASGTGTVTIDSYRIPMLIAKARMIYWEREAVPVTMEQKGRFDYEYAKAERDFRQLLGKHRMSRLARKFN